MGRKKTIEDAALLNLIQKYFLEECRGQFSKLRYPEIAAYVAANGYPGYRVEVLRRNKKAREYIENLKKDSIETSYTDLVAYKTLDVEAFISEHSTLASLKRALIDWDSYYGRVAKTAINVIKQHRTLSEELNASTSALAEANEKIATLAEEIKEIKQKNTELEKLLNSSKKVIADYINPDIANKLLEADGVLKNVDTTIRTDGLQEKIIHSDTTIKSGSSTLLRLIKE